MALTYAQCSEIVRGRLNLPTTAKLRIQKAVSNALQIFSERIIDDVNKRYMLTTPRSVTATPTLGVIDLGATVTGYKIMIDRLHQGRLYNVNRTFTASNVSTVTDTITVVDAGLAENARVRFTNSGGALPAPLVIDTDYFILNLSEDGTFQLYTDENDPDTLINLTTTGTGTQTITSAFLANEQPLQRLTNPDFTAFSLNYADAASDKFWWLIGTSLYVYKGDGTPITTSIQFSVPKNARLVDFATSPLQELQDEFIDVLTELVAQGEAPRQAPAK